MKGMKRTIANLLVLALGLSLAACAQSEPKADGGEAKPQNTGTVYTASLAAVDTSALPEDAGFYGNYMLSDGFYGTVYTPASQTEAGLDERGERVMEDVYEERLWHMALDGTLHEIQGYRGFQGETVQPDADSWTSLCALTAGEEGQVIALVQTDVSWSDAGADVEKYSDAWYAGYRSEHAYYLRVFDTATGEALDTWQLDTAALPTGDYSDGQVYVYGVLSTKGGEKKKFQDLVSTYGIKNGGTITIKANRGSYNDKIEALNAYFVSYKDDGSGQGGGEEQPTGDFASNVTWTSGSDQSYSEEATVNGTANVAVLKLGTSKKTGTSTLTLPDNSTSLTFYAVSWKDKASELIFYVNDEKVGSVSPAANEGLANTSPYTLTVTESDKYTITFPATSTVKVETSGSNTRAALFGIQAK